VLRYLPPIHDPRVLVGTATSDDAAVYQLTGDCALVATVDYFTPIVDDPYAFGAIAAANALSDIYAMGAEPLFALNLVGFPRGVLPMEVLGEIMRGGADKLAEAGIAAIGGHSIDDQEPKFGMCVIGTVHPQRVVRNAGARPGDRLYLTKPIGTGILSTAIKRGVADPAVVEAAIQSMSTLNRAAARAMQETGVHAATDVTGFGLLGHLHEMVRASAAGARVERASVPLLPTVAELARADVVPGGTRRNYESLRGAVRWASDIPFWEQLLLCDAQTSGGLLIAVPAERAAALEQAFQHYGVQSWACIGEVLAEEGVIEVV
jgi:selenide,water dikinase